VSPCAELIDDGADDVVLIGEIAIILLAPPVSLELGGELLEQEVGNTGATQAGKRSAPF
jgi:hypothetical protein